MTIGEKITSLRTSHNMSQSDLADKLNVSRQSVSKWETDSSIPDLDKLIQLSNVFNITIDELVKGETVPSTPAVSPDPAPVIIHKSVSTQRIIGFILLGFGLLCLILAMVSSLLLVVGIYSIFCSILCLTVKNNVGLKISWITFLIAAVLMPRYTGFRAMWSIFHPAFYRHWTRGMIIVVFMWLILFALIFFTLRAFKRRKNTD